MREMSTDYSGRCGNCHEPMRDNDLFCRYCGTPRGEGDFLPYENINCCVYGPPMVTTHTCTDCGYSWNVRRLGGDNALFCPECGSPVSTELKEDW
ncbi:MAG: zinc-ribbon domain-containing protein [Clostridiales bacterium]|nr:zinc-ribbon domain-containing protein [Clostridiales bacterium]